MLIELEAIKRLYESLSLIHETMRTRLNRDLTLAEKILFSHLNDYENAEIDRGVSDLALKLDRVAMQDATAQMALLQFMVAGMDRAAVPSSVHCDHLISAKVGADDDLSNANIQNKEVYEFLRSVTSKYGMGFWRPGSGIIHQVVLENYAVPGTMMIGTDSHTPNAGGLGMLAIGVGGADAVDVMTGEFFGLRMPKLVGIHLKGQLSNWASPKDVILKVAQIMTVKGGTGKIVEYFGEATKTISCTGKATITNMGAEIGATTSVFPFDESMLGYLNMTDRSEIAKLCQEHASYLKADPDIEANPEKYFDEIHEIDLSQLEPMVAGPHTPDLVRSISELAADVDKNGYPEELSAALIGSCTNSSYEDLSRAADLIRQGVKNGLKMKAKFYVSPGSEKIYETILRDDMIHDFQNAGGSVLANACGPCIGQWQREESARSKANNIITSFNRNFKKRNDGSEHTNSFIGSPELVVAMAFSGKMKFNPLTDSIKTTDGKDFKFSAPKGEELPAKGFISKDSGYEAPTGTGEIVVDSGSERLALLEPFQAPDFAQDFKELPVLLKAVGKCTTDHVSPAGPWLKYRGHLDNISRNMYSGAVNTFAQEPGYGNNVISGEKAKPINEIARDYKKRGLGWVVVADENYGEGSSREHAAMEPRHLNAKAIIARSFARIAEANLKKQGILALWLKNKPDYDLFQEKDRVSILNIEKIAPDQPITLEIKHESGSPDTIKVCHTLNEIQIKWFTVGSALNYLRENL